uniref:Craniofacial development protein 2 n=1 Tax=Schizaphis graminum TaxID=13262 RepID=A0A2S2NJR6_SCHGA
MDIVLINVHAQTEEKELFYTILEDVYESVKGNIILVLGDFNAEIGRERYYRSIIGNQSLYELSNDNGTKLVNFAAAKGLVFKSTMLPRKDIHKYTWIAPNGVYKNQIDHILINNRFKNTIKNIRTLRGANTDSDHLLV